MLEKCRGIARTHEAAPSHGTADLSVGSTGGLDVLPVLAVETNVEARRTCTDPACQRGLLPWTGAIRSRGMAWLNAGSLHEREVWVSGSEGTSGGKVTRRPQLRSEEHTMPYWVRSATDK